MWAVTKMKAVSSWLSMPLLLFTFILLESMPTHMAAEGEKRFIWDYGLAMWIPVATEK